MRGRGKMMSVFRLDRDVRRWKTKMFTQKFLQSLSPLLHSHPLLPQSLGHACLSIPQGTSPSLIPFLFPLFSNSHSLSLSLLRAKLTTPTLPQPSPSHRLSPYPPRLLPLPPPLPLLLLPLLLPLPSERFEEEFFY